ncbi:hypothetical protein F5883DRAFT_93988 [Diaporthe sp. PMI_573]|nr:hypothetical protein F5883DRAFT_93988 [Diaporthaceae sp. PMI_573]
MLDTLHVTKWPFSFCCVCMPLVTSTAGLLPGGLAGATIPQCAILMESVTSTTAWSDSPRFIISVLTYVKGGV